MPVVLVLSLPFLFLLFFKPVLRRLAFRNAIRRPRESLLVVLGALLGTAIMTGSFVVGDSFTASLRAGAHDQLGPVDELVSANGLDDGEILFARFDDFSDPDVDGVLPMLRASAASATTTEPRRAEQQVQLLETDFAVAREFGGDPAATGIDGETPAPGATAIGEDLARSLEVDIGDEIDIFLYGSEARLEVTDVLPQRGIAGFWRGPQTTSYNLFLAPGTIAALYDARVVDGEPPQALVAVSNRGGVEDGAELTDTVMPVLEAQVAGLPANVDDVKQRVLDNADLAGESLTQLYTALGSFAVLAGILLLVNIFFMLGDERKSELGMLRAVGLRRSGLVGGFALEGWCYALVSAIAGTFAGLGLARLLMEGASRAFSTGDEEFQLSLRYNFEWSSVQQGFMLGFVIAIVTVSITSVWLSRFNIIQAIRDINEPARKRPRKRALYAGLGLAALGLIMTASGVGSAAFFPLIVGPALVVGGVGPALARNLPRGPVTSVLAAIVLAWGVVCVPVAIALDADFDVFIFVLQGLLLVGASVVLIAQHQHAIGHALARFRPRSLSVRLGLAYPLARRFRTSMTLGMFALVVFILVYVTVLTSMFAGQTDEFADDLSGGFDVLVTSNPSNPVDLDALASEPGVNAVAPLVTRVAEVTPDGDDDSLNIPMTGFDQALIDNGPPILEDTGGFASNVEAYEAVLNDPSLAIVDDFFLNQGAGPPGDELDIGDSFTIRDPVSGRETTLTVAAIGPNDFLFNGGWMGVDAAREVFGESAVPSRAYVAVDDPAAFAVDFRGRFLDNGGDADPIIDLVDEAFAQQNQFFRMMRAYLALGLVIGVAGIGVIMVRAVRERRRQVGVLRALGFEAKAVRSSFVVESAFVAVEGVLVGVILALITAYSMTLTDEFGGGLEFTIPVFSIAVLVIGTLLFTLIATAAPARAAAKIQPAVALRIAD